MEEGGVKMKLHYLNLSLTAIIMAAVGLLVALSVNAVDAVDEDATYRVTIQNLTEGQPLSPPVAATHNSNINLFARGSQASPELEAIAEDGDPAPLFNFLGGSEDVTEAVNVGMPLPTLGSTAGGFSDAVTFDIMSSAGDVFSLAAMLICTNDGFIGLNSVELPRDGSAVHWLNAYDAGTEDNTEASEDLVDPCTALGPVELDGDPNGNVDDEVDTDPHAAVALHPGIEGSSALTAGDHGWGLPIAKVTITRVDPAVNSFIAPLSGVGEVPLVNTVATGEATFELNGAGDQLSFQLKADHIVDVTQAHIHQGLPDENGEVVAFLFGPAENTGVTQGELSEGTVTADDLVGPLANDFPAFVEALRNGELYVNVHTVENPSGEIRGQIGIHAEKQEDGDVEEEDGGDTGNNY
jgi:hypothetical protein